MVALKLLGHPLSGARHKRSRNAVVVLKHGIDAVPGKPYRLEAGTPWWH